MAKRVLITGGAGFIGSNLSLKLIQKGYEVLVLDNLSPQIHGTKKDSALYNSIRDKVKFIEGDVRDRSAVKSCLNGVNVIIHLAAETGTGQSMYEIEKYIDTNCRGTAVFLELLQSENHSVEKVILASSRAVYGEGKYQNGKGEIVYPDSRTESQMNLKKFEPCGPEGEELQCTATDEKSKVNPLSLYAITKFNQEQYVRLICSSIGIPWVIFRYQNVFGPTQSLKNPYTGILSIFSTQIKNGNDITIFEDGLESRDFIYIDDAVNATISGIEKKQADNEIFNVGSGVPTSVTNVAQTLKTLYKSKVAITVTGNYRIGDIRHNYADISKIKKQLNFNPTIDFEAGIDKFVMWVNEQQIEKDTYQKSIDELKAKNLFK